MLVDKGVPIVRVSTVSNTSKDATCSLSIVLNWVFIIYRMKLAPTVFACRQLINHGHVLVNGKRCNIPSRMINVGEVIALKDKAKNIPAVIEATTLPERDVPEYVEVDHSKFSGSLLRIPMPDDVPYPVQMETNLVIEFYSR